VVLTRYHTKPGRSSGHLLLLQMLYKALTQAREFVSLYNQKKSTWQEIPILLLLATPNKLTNFAKSANMATSVPVAPEHYH
jgi:hypothetical protein